MTSPSMTGFWGGVGQGLSILGQQGLQDRSEQARMQMMNDLQLARDELQNERAVEAAKTEREFRTTMADKELATAKETATAQAAMKLEEWKRADARAAATDASRERAAALRGGGQREYLDPATKVTVDALGAEYQGLLAQEQELVKVMAEGGSLSPEQQAHLTAIRGMKDDNRARLASTVPGGGNVAGISEPTDVQIQSMLKKVKPEDMGEFMAEAEKRYGPSIAARFRSFAPETAPPAAPAPDAQKKTILGDAPAKTPPVSLTPDEIIAKEKSAQGLQSRMDYNRRKQEQQDEAARRKDMESRRVKNAELSKRAGEPTTQEDVDRWTASFVADVKAGKMPPKRTVDQMAKYFEMLDPELQQQVERFINHYHYGK